MKKDCFGANDDDCGDECEHCEDANECVQEAERRRAAPNKTGNPLVGYVTASAKHKNRVHIFAEVGGRLPLQESGDGDYVVHYAVTHCGIDSRITKINALVVNGVSLDPPESFVCKACLRKWKKGQEAGVAK